MIDLTIPKRRYRGSHPAAVNSSFAIRKQHYVELNDGRRFALFPKQIDARLPKIGEDFFSYCHGGYIVASPVPGRRVTR